MSGIKERRKGAEKIAPRAKSAAFAVYTTDPGDVLSKSYALEDGKLVKAASGGVMNAGSATVQAVSNLTELAHVLAGLGPRNAISWGTPKPEIGIEVGTPFRVVPTARAPESGEVGGRKMIARTRERFAYPEGEPGVFMIDVDDPGPGKEPLTTPEEVADLLRGAVPELENVKLLVVPSGSACIHDAETGEELRGTTGWRAYVEVEDAATISQLGALLFDALWLVDEGYVKVSASGSKLVRAAVDAAVWQPERLDFVGGAQLGEGLEQRRPAPVLIPPVDEHKAKARLDVSKVAPLTEGELAKVERLKAEAMTAAEEEAVKRRAASVRRQVDRHVAKIEEREERGVSPVEREEIATRVRERLERRSEMLYADQLLDVLIGGSWVSVSVGEIIAAGERYIGCRARDPYDPSDIADRPDGDGTILRPGDRAFVFHSHAHGQNTTFKLMDHHEGENVISMKLAQLYKKLCETTQGGKEAVDARIRAAEAARQAEDELLALLSDPETWDIELSCEGLVEGAEKLRVMAENLTYRYVLFAHGQQDERVIDAFDGSTLSKEGFLTRYENLPVTYDTLTPTGNPTTKTETPAQWFFRQRDRVEIKGLQFVPGDPNPLVYKDGEKLPFLNRWRPPQYLQHEPTGDPEMFYRFIEHLVPEPREAEFLANWVACKLQNPDQRGLGVLLVDTMGGAGKGVFVRLLSELFDPRWYGAVEQGILFGTSGQAQFQDGFIEKTFVYTDEMLPRAGDYKSKTRAYEAFKQNVGPAPTWRTLSRKSRSAVSMDVYYSWIGSTNYDNGMFVPPDDRRLAALSCGGAKFDASGDVFEWLERVLPMGGKPDYGALRAIHDMLAEREVDFDLFMGRPEPFDTPARRQLIEGGEGEVEQCIRGFLSQLHEQQTCFLLEELEAYAHERFRRKESTLQAFHTEGRRLLRHIHGFEGWKIGNNAVTVVDPDGTTYRERSVVQRIGAKDEPSERWRWVGEGLLQRQRARRPTGKVLKGGKAAA